MSGEGWQLVVFTRSDARPFELPAGFRWLPGELHVRHGKTHPTQIVNLASKSDAEFMAEIAREHGFHGVIRPRFKETNIPQAPLSHGVIPVRQQTDRGISWLKANDPHYKRKRRRARARRPRM